ncbi:MAG TPA: M61 family peptidase [Terriglobia bacterium]|jgi:predicted metalloprotease with PDZ domain|nr:M61 family peptidase [Terriglobia bacterium]
MRIFPRPGAVILTLAFAAANMMAAARGGPPITLTVDATEIALKIIRVHMEVPAQPGPFTLYYPKWIPGEHEPDGPIDAVTGLQMKAGGATVPWHRDLLDVYTFHVDIPRGASSLQIDFQYLEPTGGGGPFTAGGSATDKMAVIEWNQETFYPAGAPARDIMFKPTLRLPDGWKYGTPLPVDHESQSGIEFKPVDLERLVDSPVIMGEYFNNVDVTPPGEPIHHEIDMAGDSAASVEMSPDLRQHYVNLVAETGKLFGTRHYRDYHFVLSLSDHVAHFGLEHNESNDSRVGENGLTTGRVGMASLLPHEFVHSWNGKFRRPADLATPDYEQPMKDDLLWVYEGLTDYLGPILTARSGLWTPDQYRNAIAGIAAQLGPGRPGRTWRDLEDTTFAPLIRGGFGGGWFNWKRGSDYYDEGDLVWLWVDVMIRSLTNDQKSIDDFCHIFHGGPNNGPEVKPYTFDEIVSTLNQVAPYDWAKFLRERLDSHSPEAPAGGIEAAGWKVDFNDQEAPGGRGGGGRGGNFVNAVYSVGLSISGDGHVGDCIWDSPAFKAGIIPGMTVVAVNGRRFTPELFGAALRATKSGSEPIELLVENDDYFRTVRIDYHGGPRYPHLVRIEGKPDILSEIIKARAAQPASSSSGAAGDEH